jgi:fumarate reductase flavoprotein subunit
MARGPWHEEADLVVVGASVGGLAAAVIAADRGCRTIVVERTKELGGGAATEAEMIAAAGSRWQQAAGIDDSPERLATNILAATHQHVEPELAAALAGQGAPVVAWLADRCGAHVELYREHGAAGHSMPRLHGPGERGGASLVADLARAAGRHSHVSVRPGTLAERLVRDDAGAVRGVSVRGERRGAGQALGGRVLLACGGFAGDDALVAEHCPAVAPLPFPGGARATGDGLRLGREAGAATRRLASFLITPFLATPGELVPSAPLVDLGAVLVNQAGRRFADETAESLPLATVVRAQPGRVAYLLFGERTAAAARAADPFFGRVVLPRTGRRGATLELLAKQFELDAEGLRLTVEAFNASLALGGDPFGRRHLGGPLEPPFHAIRVTGARWRSLGGLAVDATARVLDAQGQPIPGLYAAGGAAAGLGGESTEGFLAGTDTLAALGLARLAALDVIAALAASESPEPAS